MAGRTDLTGPDKADEHSIGVLPEKKHAQPHGIADLRCQTESRYRKIVASPGTGAATHVFKDFNYCTMSDGVPADSDPDGPSVAVFTLNQTMEIPAAFHLQIL